MTTEIAPTFRSTLDEAFPGSLPAAEYLDRVDRAVQHVGFQANRTLALTSICRDELTTPFFEMIEQRWGNAFTLAGLGGVPALGTTGWDAALSHVPDVHGRGSVIVFGFPHIGIEEDGTLGVTVRPGQSRQTSTCGALSAICAAAHSGDLPTEIDFDDFEATRLALRLVDPSEPPPTLLELTRSAIDAVEMDLWAALDAAEVWRNFDVSVWCGVQIHGHFDEWIWPKDAWFCGSDGVRRPVPLAEG